MLINVKGIRGTNRGYRFACLDVVEYGKRYTLAVLPVSPLTSKKKIIEELLMLASRYVHIRLVLLDRGFYDVESLNTIGELGYYLMPAKKTVKVKKDSKEMPEKQ